MTQADRERDRALLQRYREIAVTMAGDQWAIEAEAGQNRIVSTRASGETVTLALLDDGASPEELELLAGSLHLLGFFLTMQDRATVRVKELLGQVDAEKPSPYADSVADLCSDLKFRQFLETKGPRTAVPDRLRADMRLKVILDFRNTRQLDTDAELLSRFRALISEFDAWKRRAI